MKNEKEHKLKIWPEKFADIEAGDSMVKLWERVHDYKEGDTLILREWAPLITGYTGRELHRRITHVAPGALNWVYLSITTQK